MDKKDRDILSEIQNTPASAPEEIERFESVTEIDSLFPEEDVKITVPDVPEIPDEPADTNAELDAIELPFVAEDDIPAVMPDEPGDLDSLLDNTPVVTAPAEEPAKASAEEPVKAESKEPDDDTFVSSVKAAAKETDDDTYTPAEAPAEKGTDADDDVLVDGIFSGKQKSKAGTKRNPYTADGPRKKSTEFSVKHKRKKEAAGRSDARYSLSDEEIATLAAAAEDAVANGRYGAALDSVFFTAGEAREALRSRINVRIPIGSEDADLPVISAAALIESYLECEDISPKDIVEKLCLIIESSEDENHVRPTKDEMALRVFKCVVIMCVHAEQCGRHPEIKAKLYNAEGSFLDSFLETNVDGMLALHRKEIYRFAESVALQSNVVSSVLYAYLDNSRYSESFPKRFFAHTKGVLTAAIVCGVLCLVAMIVYAVTYGGLMNFIAQDTKLMTFLLIIAVLFTAGMCGIAWLVYAGGELKKMRK